MMASRKGEPTMARGRMRAQTFHGIVALSLSLIGTAGLVMLFRPPLAWAPYLAAWLVSVNVVAFGYYGFDKARARSSSSRVPEVVLHGLSVAGGSIGAYAGMQTFRHKTVKGTFRIVFWFIVVCQIGLIAAIIHRLTR
jgi:uncharacterized membrane protein YsdA (DUF1294 family)